MDHFNAQSGRQQAESVDIAKLAEQVPTPFYVYSRATLEHHAQVFQDAFSEQPHKICYSVKANSNLAVLQVLASAGCGFDIVSGGELARVLAAGGKPEDIVFSGVGKSEADILEALKAKIFCFNVESESELKRITACAQSLKTIAPISLRINPNVDAGTHPYISTGMKNNKFGIDTDTALNLYRWANEQPHLAIKGVDCHIGSQITNLDPFLEALDAVIAFADQLHSEGIHIDHLDIGGGLGVPYQDEAPPSPAAYAQAISERFGACRYMLILEPGRAIAANAGVLITRVEYIKSTPYKQFAIVDAGMNDLLRPALYQAWHTILPVLDDQTLQENSYDIVGPVCESADYFGEGRSLRITENSLLVIRSCGAYGFTMSSQYNSRPRIAEIMVDGDQWHIIREAEQIADLFANERLIETIC